MDSQYLNYFKNINTKKQINKLIKKYKNKKIILYGAGIMSKILFENYDFSKLNIVAFCDSKYKINSSEKFVSYPVINPIELKEKDFDLILVNLRKSVGAIENIKHEILINSKNEGKKVDNLLKPTLSFLIKQILF